MLAAAPTPSAYWLKGITNPRPNSIWAKTNVAIIGAGITGGSVALHLAKLNPNIKVTVLEARGISGGATGRNGGLLWPSMPDRWSNLVKQYGLPKAKQLIEFSMINVREIEAFCNSLPKDVENHPKLEKFPNGAVHLFTDIKELEEWRKEIAEMKSVGGCLDIGIWDKKELDQRLKIKQDFVGAVHDRLGRPRLTIAYRVRPASLVYHLIKEAGKLFDQGNGELNVFTDTKVEAVENVKEGLEIKTSKGVLHADTIVYCTNAFTNDLLPSANITPIRNQVVVTEPIDIPFDFAITANAGYQYMSPREDGRIVLGGFRYLAPNQDVGQADDGVLNQTVSKALSNHLPSQFESMKNVNIENEWAGIMGWTTDRFPLVGPIPHLPNQYIVAGFSGHGMPRAHLCAKAASQMILGVDVDDYFPESFSTIDRFGKDARNISFNSHL
ncbi:hypothetical protein HDV04_004088 [Boothiomyces sp. JEL0838]|nr:hypothetical protein HDV04_004075 [Boothiomyces sp. JEL0838]KAJ3311376.1 hypothetical protein HDV04_004088 [Boothiomyces sp. JEL0838]